jgi:hypothetical protein
MFNKALAKLIPNKFSQNIYDENTPVTRAWQYFEPNAIWTKNLWGKQDWKDLVVINRRF